MKYIKYTKLAIIAGAIFAITGCADDYLETNPTNAVSNTVVSESIENLYIAVNGIHRKMVSQDRSNQGQGGEPGFIICREANGDDMTWDSQGWHKDFLTWQYNTNPDSQYNYNIWQTYYQFILNANAILESLEANFPGSTEPLAAHVKGECLAIRAWAHFNLVQIYAKRYAAGATNSQMGVPYRESSELIPMERTPVEDVYSKINRDLDEAATLLKGYKAKDDTHYTEKVVYGLKARVALVQQNYAQAASDAAKAISIAESEGYKIMTKNQLTNGFTNIASTTKEVLYAAKTLSDQSVYFYSFYAYMSWNFNSGSVRTGIKCISQSTYDMMSATDLRRQWWDPTGKAEVPASNYNQRVYQNRKFTARSTADAAGEFPFMRLSEIYLIAAEAYARAGNAAEAKKYLSALLLERDPEYTDLGNSGDALAEEIMVHRRIELWGEGFRWFDLKRLNLPCKRTGSNFSKTFAGFLEKGVDEKGWCYEIPKKETDFNPLAKTNY